MNSNPDADDEINDNKEDVDDQDDDDDIDDNDDIVGDKIVSLLFQFPPTVFIPITLLFQFPALHLPLLSNMLPSWWYIYYDAVFVTKNDHFLLGVSCNHLNPP